MRVLNELSGFARGRPTAALADAAGLAGLVLIVILALG
jgi:hypothetical protein